MGKLKQNFALTESTGYWLRRTYNAVSDNLQERFDEYDVTVAQWPVLYSLYQEVCTTPAELAEYLGLYRSAITRLLDRLEKKGLVKREIAPHDKRSVRINLTKKGLSLVPKLAEISRETNNQILSEFSNKEIIEIDNFLKKIVENASN